MLTRRFRVVMLSLAVTASILACTDANEDLPRTVAPTATADAARPLPEPTGPLAGERWSARQIPPGAFLHDDGRRLWRITRSGKRDVVWSHPPANVYAIAAAPGGNRIALAVALDARRPAQPSSVMYLLEKDGSIVTVDVTRRFQSVTSPVFLRPPTQPDAEEHLYWLRIGEDIDEFGRLASTPFVLTAEGPRPITVPLRYTEAPFDLEGYPGAATFTLTLFRQNDTPTRGEVLLNKDFFAATEAAIDLWGDNEPRLNTDSLVGVAWTSPTEYVIPFWDAHHPKNYELRLFRLHCEYLGSQIIYRGNLIDTGYRGIPWTILPAGNNHVFVLGRNDVTALMQNRHAPVRWTEVTLEDASIKRTPIAWQPGGWTWVVDEHDVDPDVRTNCSGSRWIFP